jgi:general stress protein CsbA
MEAFLLSIHVVAGILFVGPVTVATSLFPRCAPTTVVVPDARVARSVDTARLLHRITRSYGVMALVVPVVGLVLSMVQGRTTEVWILVAMVLTAVAGALLALRIAPGQADALAEPDDGAQLRRLGMLSGLFNLLWVIVVVLMIVRPGSEYS